MVSHVILVYFLEIVTTGLFKKRFLLLVQVVSLSLEWLMEYILALKSKYKIMKKKAGTHTRSLEKTKFFRSPNPILKEDGTSQGRQIF